MKPAPRLACDRGPLREVVSRSDARQPFARASKSVNYTNTKLKYASGHWHGEREQIFYDHDGEGT